MVKEGTGSAFKDLVSDGRLSRAAFLLLTTEAPISQIANQCGYSNQNFFYKKFQVRYGCTPAVYRATGGALAEDIRWKAEQFFIRNIDLKFQYEWVKTYGSVRYAESFQFFL